MIDSRIEKITSKLSVYNSSVIIGFVTFVVVLSSIPLVYLLMSTFSTYSTEIFVLSVATPALMVPPTLIVILKMSRYLKTYKEHLEYEVEENKKKDILLFEQARFAMMGEMLANISHQWKQPLNTMGLAVVSAKTSDMSAKEIDKTFTVIEENISYLADTINDFMSFFDKRASHELKCIDSLIREIDSIVGHVRVKKGIDLKFINSSDKHIEIVSSISQVLINLINNAADAFSGEAKNQEIKIEFIAKEKSLVIECCDNASGIDPLIVDKIFDPYFTTKEKSQGTGIGLYMSKQIIQKIFNAHIKVESQVGKTCFYIDVPYSDKCVQL